MRENRTWSRVALTAKPGSPHRGGERLDLVNAEIVALAQQLLTPLLPDAVKQLPVAVDDPTGCSRTAATTRSGASWHNLRMNGPPSAL